MVELRRLDTALGPLVRQWRNSPKIARFMYSDHYISEHERNEWMKEAPADEHSYY